MILGTADVQPAFLPVSDPSFGRRSLFFEIVRLPCVLFPRMSESFPKWTAVKLRHGLTLFFFFTFFRILSDPGPGRIAVLKTPAFQGTSAEAISSGRRGNVPQMRSF